MSGSENKIESIQALRAIAFLGIFFLHSNFIVNWGWLGVSVFFVLSGFLMYLSKKDKSYVISFSNNINFAIKRIKKLYPLHILTMILTVLPTLYGAIFVYDLFTQNYAVDLVTKIILNITLTQSWIPDAIVNVSLNGVAWYFSVALFLYFMFPILQKVVNKLNIRILVLVLVAAIVLQIITCIPFINILGAENTTYRWYMYCFPVFRLVDFFAGMTLAKIYLHGKRQELGTLSASIIEIIALILTFILLTFMVGLPADNVFYQAINNWTSVNIIISSVWIWLFVKNEGVITKALSNKAFIYVGNISPYLFLIHYVITQFTTYYLIKYSIVYSRLAYGLTFVELAVVILLSVGYKKFMDKGKPFILF